MLYLYENGLWNLHIIQILHQNLHKYSFSKLYSTMKHMDREQSNDDNSRVRQARAGGWSWNVVRENYCSAGGE